MSDDSRLFDLDGIPEVPLFREPRRAKAARGVSLDARFQNDYPPEWDRCLTCGGSGRVVIDGETTYAASFDARAEKCPDCLGMGSLKARVRLEAGHRCERCLHPYIPKGDAKMLGVEPSPFRWSPCDASSCVHPGPVRYRFADEEWCDFGTLADEGFTHLSTTELLAGAQVEAEWRILTVHHLDGDKANCRWWNLAVLDQRCHLEIQAKVVLERVYPHEHTAWFRPHAAGWYAYSYLGEDLTRAQTLARLNDLLDLERVA